MGGELGGCRKKTGPYLIFSLITEEVKSKLMKSADDANLRHVENSIKDRKNHPRET